MSEHRHQNPGADGLQLTEKWASMLGREPETGMGYQVVSIVLRDGRQYDDVRIVGGAIRSVADGQPVPFLESEIERIVVTHGSAGTVPDEATFSSCGEFESFLRQVTGWLEAGRLRQVSEDVSSFRPLDVRRLLHDREWPDIIEVEFLDGPGNRYRLFADCYHGSGGRWSKQP